MNTRGEEDQVSRYTDARTLAAWCSRSGAGYNCGAWQAVLLLHHDLDNKHFMREVAEALVELDLPADHPAMKQWSRELADPPKAASR